MSYRVNTSKVVREHFADETILINMDTCVYYSLNEAAREVFKLVEAGHEVEGVADALAQRFEIEAASLPEAVRLVLEELLREGLVEAAAAGTEVAARAVEPAGPRKTLAAPVISRYTDMQDLLLLDPIHDVDATGWPQAQQAPKDAGRE